MNNFELEDEILDILEEKLDKKELNKIEEQILSTKGKLEILLGGTYKNTPYNQKIELTIGENEIILDKIISTKNTDLYLLLLLRIAIENNIIINGKAEPFIHKKLYNKDRFEKRKQILRKFYESFLFKSIGKIETERYKLKFDFESLTNEEKKVLYNRLKYWKETGKYPKIF